jgi:hypothetical protein
MARPIPNAHFDAIFAPRDPAASLRASADAFDALGDTFSADFSRRMARDAERDPTLYVTWAKAQAERVNSLQEQAA